MTESQDESYAEYEYPADLVAEHTAILDHGAPEGPPIRLRGPRDPAPTRAQVKTFKRRSQLKRARHHNATRIAARRVATRRAPRQRRARRVSSVARARAPTSSDPPPGHERHAPARAARAPLGERP